MRRAAALSLIACLATLSAAAAPRGQPIRILSVDATPFVSPGPSRFGPQNTMGLALQKVDSGGLFDVTELTPEQFRSMGHAELSAFDLIAINNHPARLRGSLGTTWHQVVGVLGGGRVFLCSHDAVRFHLNAPAGALSFDHPGPGVEPFGADELIRQAALWAGGVPGRTGLLVFNDAPFFAFAGGLGWDNLQLSLPFEWGISDLDPFGGLPLNGDGYSDIVAGFEAHPVYAGLSDVRFDVNTITSFGGNITAASFHTVIGTYEAAIFTAVEVIVNAGDRNPGDLPVGNFNAPGLGLDGRAIALVRNAGPPPTTPCSNGVDDDGDDAVDAKDPGCASPVDLSETPDCADGLDNDGDGAVDLADDRCGGPADLSERSDCMDGIDNDGDGATDFPEDPGCAMPAALSERPDCADGLDNDGDERIDAEDAGCQGPRPFIENPACNDGLDNDADGLVDFDGAAWFDLAPRSDPDPGCRGEPWGIVERRGRCGLGFELVPVLLGIEALRARRRSARPAERRRMCLPEAGR